MMLNDSLGDCTIASIGHGVQVLTANSGTEMTLPDQAILEAYEAVSGYNPVTGANDNGAVELDVLNYWRQVGVGGHKLDAYAALHPQSQRELMEAIYLFGGAYLGLALPLAWQSASVWDVPHHLWFWERYQWQPGSWGGHAVWACDYDARGVTVVTWGQLQRITWQGFFTYCEEAYAPLAVLDWTSGKSQAPNRIDAQALLADLQAITS
jgi:hypothetical protein